MVDSKDWYPKRRLGDLPAQAACRWKDRPAMLCSGTWWTYSELNEQVDRVAKGLIALGIKPQDKVALWMVNRAEFVFAFFAIIKIGAVAVPLNTRYRLHDFSQALRLADCSALLVIDRSGPIDYSEMMAEAIGRPQEGAVRFRDFPVLQHVVVVGENGVDGAMSWERLIEIGAAVPDDILQDRSRAVSPDAPAMIIYTSGTTGVPKGAMHSHICIRACEERSLMWGATREDTHLNYLPLFHLYAITAMVGCVLTGGRHILMDHFEAETVLRTIEQHRVSFIHGFDTHWRDLSEAQSHIHANLSSLKVGSCASGPVNAIPVAYRAQSLCTTVSGFGMTEVWSFVAMSYPNGTIEQRCETSGYPMPGVEIKIVEPETGNEMPVGQAGEIWIKSYTNMLGYYANPEATDEVLQDGWVRSGDTGLVREDGYLTFLGRYKDMLKVGGENVAPAEIEYFLCQMPGVQEAAVVGVPDDRLHEVPAAYVVCNSGNAITLDELQAHCRGKIASFKIPRYLFVVETLPLTPTGKVRKPDLRVRALQSLEGL